MFSAVDSDLYASMNVLDVVECNMPRVYENVSLNVYPHAYDDMLHESLGVSKSRIHQKIHHQPF